MDLTNRDNVQSVNSITLVIGSIIDNIKKNRTSFENITPTLSDTLVRDMTKVVEQRFLQLDAKKKFTLNQELLQARVFSNSKY